MKVCFTVAERSDGTHEVLYAGDDAQEAVAAYQKVCDKPKGFVSVAAFRKPPAYKRRRFECTVANARMAAEAEALAKDSAQEHEEAKVKAAKAAKDEGAAKLVAERKAREEAIARQEKDLAERTAVTRKAEADRQSKEKADKAARAKAKADAKAEADRQSKKAGPAKAGTPNAEAPEVL